MRQFLSEPEIKLPAWTEDTEGWRQLAEEYLKVGFISKREGQHVMPEVKMPERELQ